MVDEVITETATPMAPADGMATNTEDRATPEEIELVKDLMAQYKTARAFDRPQLRQIAKDRGYASGFTGRDAPVNANLLGSYIDILVSFIYARNPKVSIRPAEQTGQAAQRERQLFAKTLQIVVQRMWTEGKLKDAMKRVVRAGFSVASGWFKAVYLIDTETDPQIEHQLNDARDNVAKIRAKEEEILDPSATGVSKEAKVAELELLIQGLEAKVEVVLRKGMAIDFIATEQMQVAMDVRDTDDYLEAGWVADEMFVLKSELLEKFSMLTPDDVRTATVYFQRAPTEYTKDGGAVADFANAVIGDVDGRGEANLQYSTNVGVSGPMSGQTDAKAVEYAKVIELWDRRDVHIKTMVEGVNRWAKPPFTPKFASSRFYPYFKVDFFPVDGERHAQSLTFRLDKLQDEYAGVRSAFRQTRRRSIPGVLFNKKKVSEESLSLIAAGVHGEFTGIDLLDPEEDINNVFAPKPQVDLDPMLFETSQIIGDMEKLSGVQEALQTSQTVEKTATQAEIEQGGFAARTTSERDCVEETLSQFARYTAELALQALTFDDVVKIAGPKAFWPEGLPIEAITSLLEVDIEAGSTGRPNAAQEREAWIQIFPIAKELITIIMTAPGTPISMAFTELLRETFSRFDDRLDIERFLPGIATDGLPLLAPDPMMSARDPNTGLPMPAAPGAAPGMPMPGGESALPAPVAPDATGLPPTQTDPIPQVPMP